MLTTFQYVPETAIYLSICLDILEARLNGLHNEQHILKRYSEKHVKNSRTTEKIMKNMFLVLIVC